MREPPRPVGEGVIPSRMWRGIFFVGIILATGTLFVLDASMPAGSSLTRRLTIRTDDGLHDTDAVPDLQRGERTVG